MIKLDAAKVAQLTDRETDDLYIALTLVSDLSVGDWRNDPTREAVSVVLDEWRARGMMSASAATEPFVSATSPGSDYV